MTYSVTFTESNNPAKTPIVVADGTLNQTTNLSFVGQNYSGYGSVLANNFLHLLENFAGPTAPGDVGSTVSGNPVQGQLWYDTSTGLLKVWDSTSWTPTGALKKQLTAPSTSTSSTGDLWVDLNSTQLKMWTGSTWALIGPQVTSGNVSGPQVETISDTSNIDHYVVSMYANNNRIAIFSKEAFTPKYSISGYSLINEGITLSTVDSTSTTCQFIGSISGNVLTVSQMSSGQISVGMVITGSGIQTGTFITGQGTGSIGVGTYYVSVSQSVTQTTATGSNSNLTRFWGTAATADSLLINNNQVSSSNFLRSDQSSTTNYPLGIRQDGGLTVGNNLTFNIGVTSNIASLYNQTNNSSMEFILTRSNSRTVLVHLDGVTGRIGLGTNNVSPNATLDVAGEALIKDDTTNSVPGRLVITGTSNIGAASTGSQDPGGASIQTLGGLTVAKDASVGGSLTSGPIVLNNFIPSTTTPNSSIPIIQPGSDSADASYDIGSSSRRFRNIYAQNFVGAFSGSFSGYVQGSISGAAAKLASPTVFQIRGDVTSINGDVTFNGQSTTQTATFQTSISQTLITTKTALTDSTGTDKFLVYRSGLNAGLYSMTKDVLLKHVPTVPIGSILPFAGPSAQVPAGYLLCDGSEVQTTVYGLLFAVIGYIYKPAALLLGSGTFALPDLRGRFPLGADNMDNGNTVPDKNNVNNLITTITTPANRVSDVTADTVGNYKGQQAVTITVNNLPEHTHTLNSGVAQYYASGIPGGTPDATLGAQAGYGMPASSTGYGFAGSGGVTHTGSLGTAVNVMNPYQTINYIIYTGVL